MALLGEIPNDHCFSLSAPTTASPCGLDLDDNNICFYSAPTSPTNGTMGANYDLDRDESEELMMIMSTPPRPPPKTYEDEFEFETSHRFNIDEIDLGADEDAVEEHQRQYKGSLPVMAFADELFYDGKVMPLKPPPCHQYATNRKLHNCSSPPVSAQFQTSKIKIPFPRWNVWNDDFDPFMVALKTIQGERREKWQKINRRRARSMSPIRPSSNCHANDLMGCMHNHCKQLDLTPPNLYTQLDTNGLLTHEKIAAPMPRGPQQHTNANPRGPKNLTEPKGVQFARKARLVKMDPHWPRKPNKTTTAPPWPMGKAAENARESGEPCERESKRQRMKNFLYRSLSIRRSDEQKQTDQSVEISKPKIKRKLSFKSVGLVPRNEENGASLSQIIKIPGGQYKRRLFLCMGSGAKYVQ